MLRVSLFLAFFGVLLSAPAYPQQRQGAKASGNAFEIGKAGAWGIFTSGEGRSRSCFIMAGPAERSPKGLTRDPATMFITMRQGEPNKPEFSMVTGYPLKQNTDAQLSIGGASFSAIGQAKSVWLKNAAEEGKLIGELRKGSALQVKGTSLRGNETTDRYSLTGFGQALERAQKECS
jgi:Invasion associated locus B (IalB) protein